MRALFTLPICLTLCVFLAACSSDSKLLKVKGTLTHDGKPLRVDPKGSVQIVFMPVAEEKQARNNYPTEMKPEDSSFIVLGRTGAGIPPGKYRITIMQMVPNPTPEITDMNLQFDAKNSTIIRDITSDAPLVIDLAKP